MNERMTELIYQEKYYLRGRIQMVYQMKTRSRELNRMDLMFVVTFLFLNLLSV